jgi:hypothetical protein
MSDYSFQCLSESEWQERQLAHVQKLQSWVKPHLKRHEMGEKHAVYDFLFGYYSFRASLLMRWGPGIGCLLEGAAAEVFFENPYYARIGDKIGLNPERFPQERLESAHWILSLVEKTAARPPQYGCSGLHEWAMEYQSAAKRYPSIPLRMQPKELEEFVASQEIRCSHHDAFRFFTPTAKPLNRLSPSKVTQPDFEQPGCLHTNMDLYKWAYKFSPWIGSDLIAETFLLAAEARQIDMCASPYDLTSLGFEPIRIETQEGRAEYLRLQSEVANRAVPLRKRVADAYRSMIEWNQLAAAGVGGR